MRNIVTPHGSFAGVRGFLSPLTWTASRLWDRAARARARMPYAHRTSVPVISVGNLQVGGTGKTPMALWLMGLLRDHYGRRPVLLSRGYGRATRGTWQVPADGHARDYGDEPVLVARAGHSVIVGRSRAESARMAVEQLGADVLVLDDGLQQRDLAVDLQLVLWDGTRAGSDACMPYGCLRAPLDTLSTTDLLILRRDAADPAPIQPRMDLQCLEAGYADLQVLDSRGARVAPQGPVLLAAGVGNPERLARSLPRAGIELAAVVALVDHSPWDAEEVARVAAALKQCGARAVLITAKDAVKRADWDTLLPMPVYVVHSTFGPRDQVDHQLLARHLERLWPTR